MFVWKFVISGDNNGSSESEDRKYNTKKYNFMQFCVWVYAYLWTQL